MTSYFTRETRSEVLQFGGIFGPFVGFSPEQLQCLLFGLLIFFSERLLLKAIHSQIWELFTPRFATGCEVLDTLLHGWRLTRKHLEQAC